MDSPAPERAPLAEWDRHAVSWDEFMGDDGNEYFRFLELPALDRMIERRQRGHRALDLATGNGLVARWLAQEGASVIATDGSKIMVDQARARSSKPEGGDRDISFQVLDVTDMGAWEEFISTTPDAIHGFDTVTMNMGIMDIEDLEPLAVSLRRILKSDGCFVATVLHPLFMTSGAERQITVREDPDTGVRGIIHSINMTKYAQVPPARQLLFAENGRPPFCFHRPLHGLFAPFFRAGLVLDALEEPNFDASFRDPQREYSSKNFTQFPKILAFRLRVAS